MIYPVFSIRDLKGDFYSPVVHQNEVSAIRWFSMIVNAEDSTLNSFPADFQLYCIGDFDSEIGRMIPRDLLQLVTSGLDVLGKE